MSTSQNVETCKKGYAAFAAGDVETVMSLYDDDVEWVVPGNSTISGTYRGKAGVTELFAKAGRAVLYDNAQPFPRRRRCRGHPHPSHRRRRIRTPSRCGHLPRRQNRQNPELRGHCHA